MKMICLNLNSVFILTLEIYKCNDVLVFGFNLFEGLFHAKNEEHFSIRTRHITIKEARKVKEISKKTTRFWPFRITLSQVNQVCQIAPSRV